MKSFRQFSEDTSVKEAVFTFGRFNPPTIGHLKLLDKVASLSRNYFIYASHSNDKKKNPLEYEEKIQLMRKMFPKHSRYVIDSAAKNVFEIAGELYNKGYNKLIMVVGSDRVEEFNKVLKKYDNVKASHGFYHFPNGIDIVSAGERDPDSEDTVSGMSASKMRAAAADGDLKKFLEGLPTGYSNGQKLFNLLRVRMDLPKIIDFREHIQLPQVSPLRERYIRGEVFNRGDVAMINEKKIVVITRGTNYIVDEYGTKYWINSLTETTEKNQRFLDMFNAIDDRMLDGIADAANVRLKLSKKLSEKKFETMSIPEIRKRLNEFLLRYK